jgi:pimeloyl-ACP methyl ester carboxylesterase
VTVVWGRNAKAAPLTKAEGLVSHNPGARLAVFDDAGMDVASQCPEELVELIDEVMLGVVGED